MNDRSVRLKREKFLAAYEEIGSIRGAARVAEVSHSNHYRWLAEVPGYTDQFAEAQRIACHSLEEEARRRAVEGWEEPVYQGGAQVGVKRRYSDVLLIFLLKGNAPEKFGDRITQTLRPAGPDIVQVYIPDNGRGGAGDFPEEPRNGVQIHG